MTAVPRTPALTLQSLDEGHLLGILVHFGIAKPEELTRRDLSRRDLSRRDLSRRDLSDSRDVLLSLVEPHEDEILRFLRSEPRLLGGAGSRSDHEMKLDEETFERLIRPGRRPDPDEDPTEVVQSAAHHVLELAGAVGEFADVRAAIDAADQLRPDLFEITLLVNWMNRFNLVPRVGDVDAQIRFLVTNVDGTTRILQTFISPQRLARLGFTGAQDVVLGDELARVAREMYPDEIAQSVAVVSLDSFQRVISLMDVPMNAANWESDSSGSQKSDDADIPVRARRTQLSLLNATSTEPPTKAVPASYELMFTEWMSSIVSPTLSNAFKSSSWLTPPNS